ncbi:T9SS type B sorting domain-containing protein [Mangrovimonas sp. AS39]|uniref:T9SS type B sorting domain-containing protein n=1 Tax=Mangrovimonas futianensis TaxID=2895523 RepID=UPI001E58521A|nr:T9SS type B sorting domain-containing protein [Mangrovimonas futianensis]MCF1192379.1 T9SS type B sorting domain-containing protein [Mangrovimonas futianensis]MCF1195872.1 T9SS type B sorting domain-containing protein [Mangrovimonas futianensis]
MVDLGDGASIDPATGEIIGGLSGATYTVTYAFENVCSEPTTLDVTVIVTDDPSFTLTPTCDGATAEAVTPGGTYAFTDPQPTDAVISAATGTITGGAPGATYEVVYTTNGTCPDTTTNTVTVHPLPTLAQDPAELIVCDDNTPDGVVEMDLTQMDGPITGNNPNYVVSYHASQADADAGTPEVAPSADAYVGTDGEVVYVRVESVNTGCHTTTTLTLQVVGAPAANIPQALTYCDPDNDDLGEFDLDSTIEEITGGDTSLDVTFHLTYQNAVDDVLPQSSPLSNVLGQVIYVRVDYAGVDTDCPTIVELQLIVQPTPEIADPSPLELCDDAVADGMTQFDLTQANTEILNGLDPTLYTVTYYTEVADAEIGPSAPSYIAVPTAYTNQFTPQTLGVRVEDNTTLCFRTTTLELIVNPLPTPAQTQEALQLSICDDNDDNDGYAAFDLTDQDGIITSGTPSWSVDYYETAIDRDNDNPIADYTSYTNTSIGGQPHNPQTIYVKVTDQDTGCYAYSTLTLEVSPLPTPTPAENLQDLVACDDTDTGDLSESFDLTVMEDSIILPGETGLTATYHTTEEGAEEGDTSIADATAFVNTQTPQTVWVRVTNDQTGCYNVTSFQVVVNPLPDASAELEDLIACELNTDGVYTFDLTQQDATILNGQDPSSYGVTYYTSLSGAQNATGGIASPWAFTNTVNPQEIFVNIMDLETRCDIATISFFVEVQEAAEANTPEPFVLCDDNMEFDGDPTDDSVAFDLSTQNATVLNGQDPANFTVSYYETEADALAMDNAIANPTSYMNLSNPQTVWVRVDNDTTPDSICYDITTLELQVAPIPSFVLEDVYVLCTDTNGTEVVGSPLMDTGLDASAYSFEWSEATDPAVVLGTDSSYMPTVAGTYTVVVTDVDNGCSSAMSAEVILSSPPVVQATVTTQAFADNHVVTVTATGATDAVFEFSIDNGPWVSNEPNDGSYVFENLSFGEHLVQVRDINGCGIGSDTVTVMDYPLFFTPNGDGDNDTWQIYNINTQVNAKIYIFDRYGKLLKQLSPTGEGWDGTYNGELMPSSDYWFTVEYTEPEESNGETKILKEHFTLKR